MSAPIQDGDLVLTIGGQAISGWTETRVTRGIERCTGDFDIAMTDPAWTDGAAQINTGAACQIKLGADLVLSGWVDRVSVRITAREHTLRVTGRGRCEDLIDAAAEWPGGQITGANVLEVAQKLGANYNPPIAVSAGVSNLGPEIPKLNLMLGETPWQIIERLCRYAQLIAYEQPDGSLLLTQAGSTQAASGFVQGKNILEGNVTFSQDQCFSEYDAFLMVTDVLGDLGQGGNQIGSTKDPNVKRNRKRFIIAEATAGGQDIAQKRVIWESARRRGQGLRIEVTADSWRDASGALWLPNTLAPVDMPAWRVPAASYCIGEVSYLRGAQGTTAKVVLMPKEAFLPEPLLLLPALPELQNASPGH